MERSQESVAAEIGVSRQQVSRYESGENDLTVPCFWRYSDALEIDPCRLATTAFSCADQRAFRRAIFLDPAIEEDICSLVRTIPDERALLAVREFVRAKVETGARPPVSDERFVP